MRPTPRRPVSRRDFIRTSALAAAGGSLALAGCSTSSPKASTKKATKSSGTLTMSQPADATTMDPQLQGDVADMNILINMFDCLTTRNAQNQLVPQLATSWRAVNATTWRFTLRKGVKFHNGEPFNAAAVKYSIERMLNPSTGSPIVEFKDAGVTGVNVIDDYTADIVSNAPAPIIPQQSALFDGVMVPPNYIEQNGAAYFAKHPVGTGPFKFAGWTPGVEVAMEANQHYWGGPPSLSQLVIKPVPDSATALASLQSGELDMVTGLVGSDVQPIAGVSGFRIASVPGIRVYFVDIDTETPGPLADVRVRQALNYAIDVKALVKVVLAGYGQRIATLFPSNAFGYDAKVSPYPYDPQKAKQLLAAAGYPSGFSTTMSANATNSTILQAIAGQLASVGVNISQKTYAVQTFTEMDYVNHGNALGPTYVVNNSGWSMDGYSYLQSYIKPSSRSSRWNNTEATDLVNTEQTSVNPAARQSAFEKLQNLMIEQAPFIFLYVSDLVLPMSTQVSFQPNALGMQAMNNASISVS
jgi:peptide/nickel transport system substrate-binding protein